MVASDNVKAYQGFVDEAQQKIEAVLLELTGKLGTYGARGTATVKLRVRFGDHVDDMKLRREATLGFNRR